MKEKTKLVLCLGSSCYSRGNQHVLEIVKQYLNDNDLKNITDFRGQLCTGNCSHGPILKINDVVYNDIDTNNVLKILNKHFFKS